MFKLSASDNKIFFAEVAPLCSVFRATEAARSLSEVQNLDSGDGLRFRVNFLPTTVSSKTILELSEMVQHLKKRLRGDECRTG